MGRFNSVILVMIFSAAVAFGLFLNVGDRAWLFYIFAPLWGFGAAAIVSMISVLIGEYVSLLPAPLPSSI